MDVLRTGRRSPAAAVAGALLLATLLAAPAGATNLVVLDSATGAPISVGYRFLVEKDLTYHVPFDASGNPLADTNTLAVGFHRSYMPVVAKGTEANATIDVAAFTEPSATNPADNQASDYFYVSVLPNTGYSIGGAGFHVADGTVTVYVNPNPIPTAQIIVFVHEDISPINNVWDLNEPPLADFEIILEDAGGRYGASAGIQSYDFQGNPLGTEYAFSDLNGNGTQDTGEPYTLDADGAPIVTQIGDGISTGPDGYARIQHLAPGKYGIQAVPPAGQGWQQTSTIEGTIIVDAWVKANEPRYFAEFGPPGPHVEIGFIKPFVNGNVLTGGETLTGQVVNMHMSRPPDYALYEGAPFPHTTPWVGLNLGAAGEGQGVFAARCDEDGFFSIPNVPDGSYQLVIWDDNLDLIFAFKGVTIANGGCVTAASPTGGGSCNLGQVPAFQWFTRLENWVFNDNGGSDGIGAGDGIRECYTETCDGPNDEHGIPEQNVNLRWRDGTINQAMATDLTGFVPFDEVFPFFAWQVAEVDFARFKATGATVYVDDGGAIDPNNTHSWGGNLNPQPQGDPADPSSAICDTGDCRIEQGVVLTEGYQGFIGQTSVIEWGKQAYGPGENGGISGVVFYSTTRAEDDPRYGAPEVWEPGIPGVTVNLYKRVGTVDTLVNTTTTDSFDASWPELCQIGGSEAFLFDPDGPGGIDPRTIDCYDGMRVFNQVRPAIFDGGYAFDAACLGGYATGCAETSPIPPGRYVVEVVPPSGYEIVRSQDKNVDFGDEYIPSSQLLPPECVGADYEVPKYLSRNTYPATDALHCSRNPLPPSGDGLWECDPLPGVPGGELVPANIAGQVLPDCNKKLVTLSNGANAAADFFLFTEVPIATHGFGMILDDATNEFDPNSPQFGEKYAPPFMPVAVRDWTGREIGRTYSDGYGRYNFLAPSTWTANLPQPSGMSPNMLTSCMNANVRPDGTQDPLHDLQYSQFCYTLQFMPGTTTYLDTPVVPVAAFTGPGQYPLDCEFPDGTPRISQVVDFQGRGAFVGTGGGQITISSPGTVQVPNPDYQGIGGPTPALIGRDFGFGATPGTVRLVRNTNGAVTNLNVGTWNNTTITATVPTGLVRDGYQVEVVRGDNGAPSVNTVTLQVGLRPGATLRQVANGQSIQAAIDAANPNDIISVGPGRYQEMVIMWKPVQLQGWGENTIIDAVKLNAEALQAWRDDVKFLVENGLVDLLPGQEAAFGGIEPAALFTEEGAGVLVLAKANGNSRFAANNNRGARISNFTISGADTGGGVIANGFAEYLEISNNRIINNSGFYGGGIRLGHPALIAEGAGNQGLLFPDAQNNNIFIHHNYVGQNGGQDGAGAGVSVCTGADNYRVAKNFVCGNFNLESGGGVAHYGLSTGGQITGNTILFNQSFFQATTVNGGGLLISGQPAFGCPVNPATGVPDPACLADPTQTLSPGSGSVQVIGNLIQGNAAEAGDGGGVRLNSINGQEVEANRNQPNRWYQVNLYNNIIANNVAALAGGGISLQDAVRVNIIHNTIVHNDSTATAGEAFPPGVPTLSVPQPGAGIAARAHSAELMQYLTGGQPAYSNPTLTDNIVWQNRQFLFSGLASAVDPNLGQLPYGLCPDLLNPQVVDCSIAPTPFGDGAPVFSNLAVLGAAGTLTCTGCFTDDTDDPGLVSDYFNGNRQQGISQNEFTTIQTPAAFDEGGNFIRLIFGPLTLTYCATAGTPCTDWAVSDHHLLGTSTAIDAGTSNVPAYDFDNQVRPSGGASDQGADEYYVTGPMMKALPGDGASFENHEPSVEGLE